MVLFNDHAFTIDDENYLIHGTNKNKDKIIELIEDISEEKGTNFEDAFNLIFDVLDNSSTIDEKKNCLNII